MIKVPITYTNFDGEEVTEEHYFHLSKSELIDMAMANDGEDYGAKLERIGKSGDGTSIIKTFKEIIASAYGQRVDGSGSAFYKDPDLTNRFLGSLAFDQLLEDLLTNEVSAAAFANGLLPSGLEKMAEKMSGTPTETIQLPAELTNADSGLKTPIYLEGENKGKALPWAFREPTQKEIETMTTPQMQDVYRRKVSSWKPPAKV